jgi:hypothetical protein
LTVSSFLRRLPTRSSKVRKMGRHSPICHLPFVRT